MNNHPAFGLINGINEDSNKKFQERRAKMFSTMKQIFGFMAVGFLGIIISLFMIAANGFNVVSVAPGLIALFVTLISCSTIAYKNFSKIL